MIDLHPLPRNLQTIPYLILLQDLLAEIMGHHYPHYLYKLDTRVVDMGHQCHNRQIGIHIPLKEVVVYVTRLPLHYHRNNLGKTYGNHHIVL